MARIIQTVGAGGGAGAAGLSEADVLTLIQENSAMVEVAKVTLSNSSSALFQNVFTSDYDNYLLMGTVKLTLSYSNMSMNFYTGTNTAISNGQSYGMIRSQQGGIQGSSEQNIGRIDLTNNHYDPDATGINIHFSKTTNSLHMNLQASMSAPQGSTYPSCQFSTGKIVSGSAITGFQLYHGAGPLISGHLTLYGLTKNL